MSARAVLPYFTDAELIAAVERCLARGGKVDSRQVAQELAPEGVTPTRGDSARVSFALRDLGAHNRYGHYPIVWDPYQRSYRRRGQ